MFLCVVAKLGLATIIEICSVTIAKEWSEDRFTRKLHGTDTKVKATRLAMIKMTRFVIVHQHFLLC